MRTRHMLLPCLFAAASLAVAACQPATNTGGPSPADPEPPPAAETAPADDATPPAETPEQAGADDAPPTDTAPPSDGERIPLVPKDHPQYAQVEGTGYDNACETDADCHVGGCSSEVCSADPEVTTACIMPAEGWVSAGGSCGCVEGQCTWYRSGDNADDSAGGETDVTPGRSPHALEGQGEACRQGQCPGDLTCVTYYGVAGPQGPQFSSCEIPCPRGDSDVCPDSQTCVTIADGPGQVCRPSSRS